MGADNTTLGEHDMCINRIYAINYLLSAGKDMNGVQDPRRPIRPITVDSFHLGKKPLTFFTRREVKRMLIKLCEDRDYSMKQKGTVHEFLLISNTPPLEAFF